jgi:hypothetical protein
MWQEKEETQKIDKGCEEEIGWVETVIYRFEY